MGSSRFGIKAADEESKYIPHAFLIALIKCDRSVPDIALPVGDNDKFTNTWRLSLFKNPISFVIPPVIPFSTDNDNENILQSGTTSALRYNCLGHLNSC